jgi:probable HAF family extracellular repeat protein
VAGRDQRDPGRRRGQRVSGRRADGIRVRGRRHDGPRALYGGDTSFAWGINTYGSIVGTSDTAPFGQVPFIKRGSYFGPLPLPGAWWAGAARAINADGKAAGDASTATGRQALRWPKWYLVDPEPLHYLYRGHTLSYGYAINSLGWVAGSSGTTTIEVATLWKTTAATSLGVPTSWTRSVAYGVNEDGWVTGKARLANGDDRAFLWKPASGIALLPTANGSTYAAAYGINDLGWVAGTSDGKAIVWINGSAVDIKSRVYNIQGWTNLMQFTATTNGRGFVGLGVKDLQIRGFRLVAVSN